MPSTLLAQTILEDIYNIRASNITSIQLHDIEWREVFHVTMNTTPSFVLRLIKGDDTAAALKSVANVLSWLQENHYNAPTIQQTVAGDTTGFYATWHCLLVTYIEGDLLPPEPVELRKLGSALAKLHLIPLPMNVDLPRSCVYVQKHWLTKKEQFETYLHRAPTQYQQFVTTLFTDINNFKLPDLSLSITHGDCWHMNAIETHTRAVVLIDWDCAGIGSSLFDLGYTLLTTHYDISRPLEILANKQNIQAIISGYIQYAVIRSEEHAYLPQAIRFALICHLGDYLEHTTTIHGGDAVMEKLQARFTITQAIIDIAQDYLSKQY